MLGGLRGGRRRPIHGVSKTLRFDEKSAIFAQKCDQSEVRDNYSSDWQVLEEQVAGVSKIQYVWSPVYVDAIVLRDRDLDGNPANGLEERLYAQQDANYNMTALVSTSGTVLERYVEDPYGNPTISDALD